MCKQAMNEMTVSNSCNLYPLDTLYVLKFILPLYQTMKWPLYAPYTDREPEV